MLDSFPYYPTVGWIARVKSRTGCWICKIRKVKCDEAKPYCRRCESTGRKCLYKLDGGSERVAESPMPSIRHTQPSSDLITHALRERRAFEYYCHQAGPAIAGRFGNQFWMSVVLKACRSEPAVWDGINTIGLLYENLDPFLGPPMVVEALPSVNIPKEALAWYSRSVENTRSRIAQNKASIDMALITCVLYICAEMLQGDVAKAIRLYEQAVRLILTWRRQASMTSRTVFMVEDILPLLVRLGAVVLIIAGYSPEGLPQLLALSSNNSKFSSLEDAQTALLKLTIETFGLRDVAFRHQRRSNDRVGTMFDLTVQQRSLMHRLGEWDSAFAYLTSAEGQPFTDFPYRGAVGVLLTFRAVTSIVLCTCLSQEEIVYDKHMDQFRLIVEHAAAAIRASTAQNHTQPQFTFEPDIGPPLFFTAVKCRDTALRWKALTLLRQAPKVQSLFKRMSWATLAETIIRLEENHSLRVREGPSSNLTCTVIAGKESRSDRLPRDEDGHLDDPQGTVSSANESVEAGSHCSDELSINGSHCIPEEYRVHEFGLSQANGTAPFDLASRTPSPFVLRVTRNQRDPVTGNFELVECFLPMSY
ncbi:hypothetical protein BDV41DRAFT_37489 [Aspergillus transmontanensis]|uniref:Zn(2)-C6 fungal-type domain-containing protein n=1 Tax=Aspergillus transmontanensis TaxID=1034304 RepID=A0A5N6WBP9_9EURO|nr:hypothetical protein BDV41DRAFT_37489 [Aspergillus transmontanensis]